MRETSALSQAIAVRQGEVSSTELVDAALARIERINPQIHAFVRVFAKRARAEARAMDKRPKDGALPVFFGVPTGIKDTAITAGGVTNVGSRVFKFVWSPFDGAIAKAVKSGGFVVLGKLATSELGVMPVTETDVHPPCRNPWNIAHSPGGSSGGSGSAVAAGLLPIAHAEDGGGSIRIPASFCGLYGHKPSRGLLRHFHGDLDAVGLGMVNCVSHEVEDSAAHLDVLLGRSYDPRSPPPDSLLARSRIPPRRLKIRFATTSTLTEVSPEVSAAVRALAGKLADAGHDVEEAAMLDVQIDDVLPLFARMCAQVPVLREAWLQPSTRWMRSVGRPVSADAARALGEVTGARVLSWFGDTDIWLTPTTPMPAPVIGAYTQPEGEAMVRAAMVLAAFTAIFNVGGQPAANLPVGLSAAGLPLGAQLVARTGEDALLLSLARQVEDLVPWRAMRSPLASGS